MLSLGPRCARRLCLPSPRRCIASSAPRLRERGREREADNDEEDEEEKEGTGAKEQATYKSFLQLNERFKIAKPRNWVSGSNDPTAERTVSAPFPMNPSFQPPTPISDATRSQIYTDYMLDPETNNIRALSQRYHISLKRIEAILRLKGMEASYVKNKPLQTGFLWGMEMLLGVKAETSTRERGDVHVADMLEQDENRDAARQRFQRQFWETIADDGKQPILPAALEHAKRVAERHAQAQEDHKANPRLMPRFKDTPTIKSPRQKVQTVEREGRMPIHFVDVGGKFVDVEERLRRLALADRRKAISSRKSEKKVLSGYLMARTGVERARRAAARIEERDRRRAARLAS
ncbi:eukaryotic mitochondrial regulator protein-domain-containing protein [Mycena vulgaris]|nr:eukaryotic mitochondrial regulator protein-domain-containing protein [Mycena vulgaris]